MSLSEPKIYGEERRYQEVIAELLHIHLLLEEMVEQAPQTLEIPPFPTTDLTPLQLWLQEVSQRLDRLTPASPEGIADALARRLPENPDVSPALDAVATSLSKLDKRMKNLASLPALAMPVGEINGSVTVDNDAGSPVPVSSDTLATESTLNAILDATANVEDALHAEVASIAANAWATVVSYTPTVATTVLGFNADVSGLTDIIYRMRLTVGGTVKCSETIGASANSWIPLKTDVAAGKVITVDVFHGEAVPQTFRASLSYGS